MIIIIFFPFCLWFARLFFSKSPCFAIKCIAFNVRKENTAMNTLKTDLNNPFCEKICWPLHLSTSWPGLPFLSLLWVHAVRSQDPLTKATGPPGSTDPCYMGTGGTVEHMGAGTLCPFLTCPTPANLELGEMLDIFLWGCLLPRFFLNFFHVSESPFSQRLVLIWFAYTFEALKAFHCGQIVSNTVFEDGKRKLGPNVSTIESKKQYFFFHCIL